MKIQSMFKNDIERDINGVIKVAQDDDKSLKQELSEYIITKELRKHFNTFFSNYERAIDYSTDKVGVWISGFFGSGKSHFLKILSYLLSNKEVCGKNAVDYFKDKFDNPLMYAMVQKCTSIPTESILFNIDIEGSINKDKTAILRVFAKVFYNHCGFYGNNLKVAKLERFIDKHGKTEEFRKTFKEVNGESWLETRDSYAFFEDDIVEVLQSVLGMSETAARNWFNGEESSEMSIKQLVADIKEYVDSKGDNFRLLFMVDEVGQYIGDDGDLMLNLQSLVEEIGNRCREKVWVMVTSQEAIDSVVKISGDDFSKIQGRFDTRLSLSSSSVDEVIKKRILAKNDDATNILKMEYDKEYPVLKNLYTFDNPILDIKGYGSDTEFAETYPFVPYQFIVIQKVLVEIRKHGNSGKHLSGGERSMLSGFQEAAQAVKDKDENALVPFYLFYDTVHTFLESSIRRVIDRCQKAADNHDGIEQQDVNVLKMLYLIRYIDDVKANLDNIAVLMVDDIRIDKISLRASITDSLDRLFAQDYIARNGDTYSFLTDEEQDVANDIRNTAVDSNAVTQSIAHTIFADIYDSKKFKYGKYDFPYDQYVDDTISGFASGGMRLRIVTVANDYYNAGDQKFIMDSQVNNEAIVILSDEYPYFDEIEQAMKIRKYVKTRNVSQLPETIQDIIRKRQQQAHVYDERAKEYIGKSILSGRFFVYGEKVEIKSGAAKDALDQAMTYLVESVYFKLNLVNEFAESDADILEILNGKYTQTALASTGAHNAEALREISQWLELQSTKPLPTSMGDVQRRFSGIPYGWREIDIAALVATLVADQKITIRYGGASVQTSDRRMPDYLRRKSEVDKVSVTRRIAISETLMRKARDFLHEYLNVMDIPADEDGLVSFIVDVFEKKFDHYNELLDNYKENEYPDKQLVKNAAEEMQNILSQQKDNVALLNRLVQEQDELLNTDEDMEQVENFFKTQRPIFDAARKLGKSLRDEHDYFASDPDTMETIKQISQILISSKPYNRIKNLSDLMQKVKDTYNKLLDEKKQAVLDVITQCMGDVHTLGGADLKVRDVMLKADNFFTQKKKEVNEAATLTVLDAKITVITSYKDTTCRTMEKLLAPEPEPEQKTIGSTPKPAPKKVVTLRRYDVCPQKRLQTKDEIDIYVEAIRKNLYKQLEDNDIIQLN